MKCQQFLYGLLMVVLLNGCSSTMPSTTDEMSHGHSGERIGGQAGLPQEDVVLQVLRYREEAQSYLQAAQALEKEAKALAAETSDSSSAVKAKVALARQYRQAAEEAAVKAEERRAQIPQGLTQ
jgi:hypothetical protein